VQTSKRIECPKNDLSSGVTSSNNNGNISDGRETSAGFIISKAATISHANSRRATGIRKKRLELRIRLISMYNTLPEFLPLIRLST